MSDEIDAGGSCSGGASIEVPLVRSGGCGPDLKKDPTLSDRDFNERVGCKWSIPEEMMRQSPSVARGMSMSEEVEHRRKGIRFIKYMMRYLTFEKIIQGNTIEQTKTPRVFPTAVHMFHRFYTVHPFQYFNEYVTAIACVFQATKTEEHVLPINKVLELAKINARSLPWVKIPAELSFDKDDWLDLWKNEVVETEFLVFTTVNPMRFLFCNVFGWIVQYIRSWVGQSIEAEVAVKIRDRAFIIASDVYSCGSVLVATESARALGTLCLSIVLKKMNISIPIGSGKVEGEAWHFIPGEENSAEKLKKLEAEFLSHLKQYNSLKAKEDKKPVKPKCVSPSSDYGSEGSTASNPVSPSDSMDAMSNGPTSPAESTASSSDQGLSIERQMKPPKRQGHPCNVSFSLRKDTFSMSSSSRHHSISNSSMKKMGVRNPIEPVAKRIKVEYSAI